MQFKQSIKLLLVASTALILSLFNHAHAEIEKLTLKLSEERVVSIEFVRAINPNMPTFLFLPGVNRGLIANDEALERLAAQGFGIAAINFSVQPFSVNVLAKSTKPAFRSKSFSLEELAQEVDTVSEQLRKNYQIQNIVPVSISYSSAVSSLLKNYPLIIDVVPMTSSTAVNPELETYRATLKAGEIWNPVFGPGITRSLLDQAYYSQWSSQVEAMISTFKLDSTRRSDMIEGYTVLSRAAEGFIWDSSKTPKSMRRVFLLARDDSAGLLKDQLKLVLKLLSSNTNILVFIVNKSGHILPSDQPEAYASIISSVTNGSMKEKGGVVEYEPGSAKSKTYQGLDAQSYIQNLINTL